MKIHVKLTIFIALIISSFQLEEGVESLYGDIIVLNSDSNSNLNSNLNSVLICLRIDLLLDRGGAESLLEGGGRITLRRGRITLRKGQDHSMEI